MWRVLKRLRARFLDFPETTGDKGRNSPWRPAWHPVPPPGADRGRTPDLVPGPAGLPVRRRVVEAGAGGAGAPPAPCPAEERPSFSTADYKEEILAAQPPAAAGVSGGGLRWELLGAAVVFVAVDLTRQPVILAIDLRLFRPGQPATMGRAIPADLTVHGRFFALQVRGFASGQLTALDALPDPLLLVQGALADFAARRSPCPPSARPQPKRRAAKSASAP